jgi:5-methylcytosine-specific restriction endonuclease McrA
MANRTWKVFAKETKLNRYQVDALIQQAFPRVPYHEHRHINVKGDKSPYDGDTTYWSERNSKLYTGPTAAALKRQHHTCGYCQMKFLGGERVQLHHIDGNHDNWKPKNLTAVHESCHDYIHSSKPIG